MKAILQDVVSLAREAGQKILDIYEDGAVEQQSKTDGSPLTAADMASHHTIVSGLQRLAPELPILSEESAAQGYDQRRNWSQYWLVDPLDGTKEFLKRNGEFTVNIALINDGVPTMGVVHAPVLGVTYFAARGAGAFKQMDDAAPVPIHVAVRKDPERLKLVGSRSHSDARQLELTEHLGGGDFISMGSSLKFCLVAEGSAHLYPRLGPTMEWDTAAAHCVVLEAGGIVCDGSGMALRYNKEDMHNPHFAVLAAADMNLRERLRLWRW